MGSLDPVVLPFVPEEFLDRYYRNEWWLSTRRRPFSTEREYQARCFDCREIGVMAVGVKFRGFRRPRNFLCQKCWDAVSQDERNRRRSQDMFLALRNRERRLVRYRMGIGKGF